jgi:hypothetical protein
MEITCNGEHLMFITADDSLIYRLCVDNNDHYNLNYNNETISTMTVHNDVASGADGATFGTSKPILLHKYWSGQDFAEEIYQNVIAFANTNKYSSLSNFDPSYSCTNSHTTDHFSIKTEITSTGIKCNLVDYILESGQRKSYDNIDVAKYGAVVVPVLLWIASIAVVGVTLYSVCKRK